MVLQAIKIFKQLEEDDVRLLAGMERAMRRYEYIPMDRLPMMTRFLPKDLEYRLNRLDKFGLIKRRTFKYLGYTLLPAGYDTLALWSLVKRDVLEAFGSAVGVGKEADIYDALQPDETKVAVKFNRLGRISFTRVRRVRSYKLERGWIDASRSAAQREFKVLQKIYPKVAVPQPIALDRHVLVTGLIDGDELANVAEITEPEPVLDEILENVRKAHRLGVVHADLSEHNVIIRPRGEVLIIDWPQWVPISHPRVEELLKRDVYNVLKYFRRKFRLSRDLTESIKHVKSY